MASETNSARLSVRPAVDGDLGPLTAALGPDVPAAQVTRRLEESRLGYRDMLVAELDGRVVGTVSMGGHGFQRPGSLRLFALDVGAAFRRRGVGNGPGKGRRGHSLRRALDEVNLEVAIDNKDAIRLYERLGYRRHGDPVSDRWERRLDDGSSQMVDVPSWVMINRLEEVQAATISHRATRPFPTSPPRPDSGGCQAILPV